MVIDLPFEGRKVEGSQKYRRRERVPKAGTRGEETITEPINSRIGEFHTIAVGKWWHHYSGLLVCIYVCYQLFLKTTGPNCMKLSGMIFHYPRTNWLDFGSDPVKGHGQGHEGLKNYWTELCEIFRDDLSSSKDQSIRFWERSGQRSRSRSRKGQNILS